MCEAEIKPEYIPELMQCRSCLSVGRNLSPLGSYLDIFTKIIPHSAFWQNTCDMETLQICWECRKILSKIVEFQSRVLKAAEIIQMGQSYLYGTLSSLTTVTFNDASPNTVYVTQATKPTHTETKPETKDFFVEDTGHISDDGVDTIDNTELVKTEIKKEPVQHEIKKKNNKWAKKRALLNKEPKFKIVQNYKEIFRKVKISAQELTSCLTEERDGALYNASKYKCESCVLAFKDDVSLAGHVSRHHIQTIGPYMCDICNSHTMKKSQLIQHISNHYYKYECVLCAFSCYHRRCTYTHKKTHRKVFQCVKCELMFGSRREFFKHYKEWHEKYICDHCGVSFKMRYCIEDHIRKQHSPFECKPCDKRFSRYNGLWLHNKVCHGAAGASAYCVECDRRYADVYRYRWHLSNSARHRPRDKLRIPCPGCEKVFTKKIYMKDHFDLVHLKKYKYRCEQCDKNFLRNADLVQHRRRVHEGILPPRNKICYVCGKGFSTNKILNNHVRTHTGERPFACARCPAAFAQRAALAGHARARHA